MTTRTPVGRPRNSAGRGRAAATVAWARRAMRRQQGLTQAALAERAGISRQWVCDAENNKLPGGVTMLCRLIFELGHTIELVPAPDEGFDLDAHLQEVTAQ